jgi:hypothetical protein
LLQIVGRTWWIIVFVTGLSLTVTTSTVDASESSSSAFGDDLVVDAAVMVTWSASVWHLRYQRSSTYPLHTSHKICLLDSVTVPSVGRTVLSMSDDLTSAADPPQMNLPVASDRKAVPGEFTSNFLAEMNLPVKLDLSVVLTRPLKNISDPKQPTLPC